MVAPPQTFIYPSRQGIHDGNMKISEITKDTRGPVDLVGTIVKKEAIRKTPRGNEVQNFDVRDDSGQIRVAVWGEKTKVSDALGEGDAIQVEKGLVSWRGDKYGLEVSVGRYGVVKKAEAAAAPAAPRAPSVPTAPAIPRAPEVLPAAPAAAPASVLTSDERTLLSGVLRTVLALPLVIDPATRAKLEAIARKI